MMPGVREVKIHHNATILNFPFVITFCIFSKFRVQVCAPVFLTLKCGPSVCSPQSMILQNDLLSQNEHFLNCLAFPLSFKCSA